MNRTIVIDFTGSVFIDAELVKFVPVYKIFDYEDSDLITGEQWLDLDDTNRCDWVIQSLADAFAASKEVCPEYLKTEEWTEE